MINMQELQIRSKDEEISKELLKKGNLVTSYEVTKLLNEFFDNKTPGLPYFKPIRLEKYQKSDKSHWNTMFKDIESDLQNAYSIYNNQSEYALITQSNYDMEVESIHREVDMLIYQSEILDKYSKKKIAYHPYIVSFENLKDTNTKNLIEHNIPYTTAEIDYDSSTLRNELHSTPNDKIDISNATINISSSSSKVKVNGDKRAIISDLINDVAEVSIVTESLSIPSLIISVNLDYEIEVSRIDFVGHSIYNSNVRLFLSQDGQNFLEKTKVPGEPYISFRFNKTEIKAIRIVIEKESFDYEENKEYHYYYVLKNISLYNDKYARTSVYTSNSIPFDNPISDVIIQPDHEIYPYTDIAYFIGVENSRNDIEWKSIKPGDKLDLKLLYKEEMILNYYTSDLFGAWDFDRLADQRCFYIHALPKNTNLNSIEIRAGHSQWLLERLDVSDKYGKPYPTSNKVSPGDYNKARVTEIAPLDSTMMEIKCEKEWNYFVMSQHVICSNDTIIENRYIKFDKKNEIFDAMLLINGKQIFAKNNKYAFKLKKGENMVQIMILLGNHNVSNLATTKTIHHNFNLLAYCDAIYAGPKMQRVAYNSLAKNISEHSLKYYAIKTVDSEDRIVTKFDPNYILRPTDPLVISADSPSYEPPDIKINNSEYFRMYIKFKHMLPQTKEMLTNSDGDSNIRLRLMAKLSTADISVSPIIKAIRVVGE